MLFNYDVYARLPVLGIIGKLKNPHSYTFEDLGDFLRNQEKIIPTSKCLPIFRGKYNMSGLANVCFDNRISFNYSEGEARISDFEGEAKAALSTIVSDSNFKHGLKSESIEFLTKNKNGGTNNQLTFRELICIYKKDFPGLVIVNYEMYSPIQIKGSWDGDFGIRDDIGIVG